jgi:hypothetical protein
MDNNIYRLLDYLAPTGVGVETDIANPLREIFVVTDTANESTKHQAELLKRFLDNLIEDGVIRMKERPDGELGKKHPTQGYRWLVGDRPIGAAITQKGYDLISAEKARQSGTDLESSIIQTNLSVQKVNESIKQLNDVTLPKNFSDQNKHEWRTLALAAISVVFIVLTYFEQCNSKTDKKLEAIEATMKDTKAQILKLNTSLQNVVDAIRQQPGSIRVKILKK